MKSRTEAWHDELDLARVSADHRSIMVGWVIVFAMIALGAVAPSVAPLVTSGYAAAIEHVAPHVARTRLGSSFGTCGKFRSATDSRMPDVRS